MAWKIEYSRSANKEISKLEPQIAKRILDFMDYRIATLANPRATGHALVGEWSGLWRYRVGDHRIICDIKDKEIIILVVEIGDRKDVYR